MRIFSITEWYVNIEVGRKLITLSREGGYRTGVFNWELIELLYCD